MKSVDVILPTLWNLESCQREITRQRIPTEDNVDVLVFSNANGDILIILHTHSHALCGKAHMSSNKGLDT